MSCEDADDCDEQRASETDHCRSRSVRRRQTPSTPLVPRQPRTSVLVWRAPLVLRPVLGSSSVHLKPRRHGARPPDRAITPPPADRRQQRNDGRANGAGQEMRVPVSRGFGGKFKPNVQLSVSVRRTCRWRGALKGCGADRPVYRGLNESGIVNAAAQLTRRSVRLTRRPT